MYLYLLSHWTFIHCINGYNNFKHFWAGGVQIKMTTHACSGIQEYEDGPCMSKRNTGDSPT